MKYIGLFLLVFYFIFPQAINMFGSSFIIVAGPLGLALYAYNRFPFQEVPKLLLAFGILIFTFFTLGQVNGRIDPYIIGFIRSQSAWFFAAYLIMFVMFKVHDKPKFETLAYYIVFAVAMQGAITLLMELSPAVREFFLSVQLDAEYTDEKMQASEGKRLVGYGTAFSGAGAVYGYALIFNAYILMRAKLTRKQFVYMSAIYCLIFFAGLFTARTTTVGLAVSLGLILIYYVKDYGTQKKRVKFFFTVTALLGVIGYFFVTTYFNQFTDWAFELFNNLIFKGKLETQSSNGLEGMFVIPSDFHTMMFGNGSFEFSGYDVGYTRLFFFVGMVGTFMFFAYQLVIIKMSLTKDTSINILLFVCFIYILGLNVKGYMDMNYIFYLIFFFFLFYKYYVYTPELYLKLKEISNGNKVIQNIGSES